MRKPLLALVLVAAAVHTVRHDQLPLHAGSAGPNVAKLQFLLRDPRPKQNVFRQVKGTFHGQPNGYFGAATKAAVYAYKYRLGYPSIYNSKAHPVASTYFFGLLAGRAHRPAAWVALAQRRLQTVAPGVTPLAAKIRAYELTQLGVRETCGGYCNRGPTVDQYERYFGVLGLAWCEIFQQYAFAHEGYRPPFANRSFGVIETWHWAAAHNLLNAKAKVGDLVAFLDDGGHMGYVIKIVGSSGYVTVEGNSGDAVREVYHPWNDRLRVFIAIPGVA